MIYRIAQFRVKKPELDTVIKAISDFLDAVNENEPDTVYESWQCDDNISFIHFMKFTDTEAEISHKKAAYTAKFSDILYPRCEKGQQFTGIKKTPCTL